MGTRRRNWAGRSTRRTRCTSPAASPTGAAVRDGGAAWSSRWVPRTMPQSVLPTPPVGPIPRPGSLRRRRSKTSTWISTSICDAAHRQRHRDRARLAVTRPFDHLARHRRPTLPSRSTCRCRTGRRRRRGAEPAADRPLDFDLGELPLDADTRQPPHPPPAAAGRPTTTSRPRCRRFELERRRRRPAGAQARAGRGVPPDRRPGRRARPARRGGGQAPSGALKTKAQGMLDSWLSCA